MLNYNYIFKQQEYITIYCTKFIIVNKNFK